METVRVVCGHDCPDMCSLLAHVEDGRVARVEGEATLGTINMLCADRYTDMGEGATYQSTWLDVAAYQEAA